jgi:hypothetical protein
MNTVLDIANISLFAHLPAEIWSSHILTRLNLIESYYTRLYLVKYGNKVLPTTDEISLYELMRRIIYRRRQIRFIDYYIKRRFRFDERRNKLTYSLICHIYRGKRGFCTSNKCPGYNKCFAHLSEKQQIVYRLQKLSAKHSKIVDSIRRKDQYLKSYQSEELDEILNHSSREHPRHDICELCEKKNVIRRIKGKIQTLTNISKGCKKKMDGYVKQLNEISD